MARVGKFSKEERRRWVLGSVRAVIAAGAATMLLLVFPGSEMDSFRAHKGSFEAGLGMVGIVFGFMVGFAIYVTFLGLPLGLFVAWLVRRHGKITLLNSAIGGFCVGAFVALLGLLIEARVDSVYQFLMSFLAMGIVGGAGGLAFGDAVAEKDS